MQINSRDCRFGVEYMWRSLYFCCFFPFMVFPTIDEQVVVAFVVIVIWQIYCFPFYSFLHRISNEIIVYGLRTVQMWRERDVWSSQTQTAHMEHDNDSKERQHVSIVSDFIYFVAIFSAFRKFRFWFWLASSEKRFEKVTDKSVNIQYFSSDIKV